jgi:hypothetical protein
MDPLEDGAHAPGLLGVLKVESPSTVTSPGKCAERHSERGAEAADPLSPCAGRDQKLAPYCAASCDRLVTTGVLSMYSTLTSGALTRA